MSAVFALASAVLVGGADFVGGLVSRRLSPVAVAIAAQAIGLVVGVPIALLWGWEEVLARDVGFSVVSGVAVGLGLAAFYASMGSGLISLVAPLAAVVGAAVPVVVGISRGERPDPVTWLGIGLAVVAIGIVSVAPGEGAAADAMAIRVVGLSLFAGVMFGLFYVALAEVGEDAGMWPVTLQRVGSVAVLGLLVVRFRVAAGSVANAVRPGVVVAALEVGAFMFLLLALQRGDLAVTSVLASLYPVTTVILARGLLHERLSRPQLAGVALALAAVVLVSTG